jgi:hypothetical protein
VLDTGSRLIVSQGYQQPIADQLQHFVLTIQAPVFNVKQHFSGSSLLPKPTVQMAADL